MMSYWKIVGSTKNMPLFRQNIHAFPFLIVVLGSRTPKMTCNHEPFALCNGDERVFVLFLWLMFIPVYPSACIMVLDLLMKFQ